MVHHIVFMQNMRTPCCIEWVKLILSAMFIVFIEVKMGEVILLHKLTPQQKQNFIARLLLVDLHLMEEQEGLTCELIKHHAKVWVDDGGINIKLTCSDYLVHRLGWSMDTIERCFNKTEPITIGIFCEQYKTAPAPHLLETTTDSCADISAQLHYPDPATFSKAFSKKYTVTPLQWRKKHLKGSS